MAFVAYFTDAHFIFPALSPMAFLVFSQPMSPTAALRNIVLGHLVGGLCGWGAYARSGSRQKGPSSPRAWTCPASWPWASLWA
jgi:HPP family